MKHGMPEHQKMMDKKKMMKGGKKKVSKKVSKLVREGYAQDQAVAIAHDMARRKKGR